MSNKYANNAKKLARGLWNAIKTGAKIAGRALRTPLARKLAAGAAIVIAVWSPFNWFFGDAKDQYYKHNPEDKSGKTMNKVGYTLADSAGDVLWDAPKEAAVFLYDQAAEMLSGAWSSATDEKNDNARTEFKNSNVQKLKNTP